MMNRDVLLALTDVIDPELGVNIVDLGLIYHADWNASGIAVTITMTSPTCPFGDTLIAQAEAALQKRFAEAKAIRVDLVWDPPWSPARISDAGRRQLGWPQLATGPMGERTVTDETSLQRWEH